MTRVNLIPETLRNARCRRRRIRSWSLAITFAGLSVLLPVGIEAFQYRRVHAWEQEYGHLQGELQNLRAEVRSVTMEASQTLRHLEHAEALRTKRAWSGIFATLASCLPPDCWLTSLGTDPASPASAPARAVSEPAGAKGGVVMLEAPRRLRMAGYAPDPASPYTLVRSLKDTNLFSQVTLNRSVREPTMDGQYFRFEVDCEW